MNFQQVLIQKLQKIAVRIHGQIIANDGNRTFPDGPLLQGHIQAASHQLIRC